MCCEQTRLEALFGRMLEAQGSDDPGRGEPVVDQEYGENGGMLMYCTESGHSIAAGAGSEEESNQIAAESGSKDTVRGHMLW